MFRGFQEYDICEIIGEDPIVAAKFSPAFVCKNFFGAYFCCLNEEASCVYHKGEVFENIINNFSNALIMLVKKYGKSIYEIENALVDNIGNKPYLGCPSSSLVPFRDKQLSMQLQYNEQHRELSKYFDPNLGNEIISYLETDQIKRGSAEELELVHLLVNRAINRHLGNAVDVKDERLSFLVEHISGKTLIKQPALQAERSALQVVEEQPPAPQAVEEQPIPQLALQVEQPPAPQAVEEQPIPQLALQVEQPPASQAVERPAPQEIGQPALQEEQPALEAEQPIPQAVVGQPALVSIDPAKIQCFGAQSVLRYAVPAAIVLGVAWALYNWIIHKQVLAREI